MCIRDSHSLAAQRTHLGAADVEHIGQPGKVGQRHVRDVYKRQGFTQRCRIEVLFSYNYIEERFAMLYFENDYCEGAHPAILQKMCIRDRSGPLCGI